MKITPRNDYVLVELIKKEDAIQRDVFLLSTSRLHHHVLAKVVSVGPGKVNDDGECNDMGLESGMRVVLSHDTGLWINSDGTLRLVKDEIIVGIISNE